MNFFPFIKFKFKNLFKRKMYRTVITNSYGGYAYIYSYLTIHIPNIYNKIIIWKKKIDIILREYERIITKHEQNSDLSPLTNIGIIWTTHIGREIEYD